MRTRRRSTEDESKRDKRQRTNRRMRKNKHECDRGRRNTQQCTLQLTGGSESKAAANLETVLEF